jgi:hypothetical protein
MTLYFFVRFLPGAAALAACHYSLAVTVVTTKVELSVKDHAAEIREVCGSPDADAFYVEAWTMQGLLKLPTVVDVRCRTTEAVMNNPVEVRGQCNNQTGSWVCNNYKLLHHEFDSRSAFISPEPEDTIKQRLELLDYVLSAGAWKGLNIGQLSDGQVCTFYLMSNGVWRGICGRATVSLSVDCAQDPCAISLVDNVGLPPPIQ